MMSDPMFLNLDDFADETRAVGLNGKQFTVRRMSVGEFINVAKAEKAERARRERAGLGEPEMFELIEKIVANLVNFVEGITAEELGKLSFKQLNKLMEFARAEDVAEEAAKEADPR